MQIKRIHIQNFRSIMAVDFEPGLRAPVEKAVEMAK
jgi:hypothetical protein